MVYWEYKLPSDNTALLAVVLKKGKPHVVLPGLHILDCNYGPEQNKWNKRKDAEGQEKKQNVDHSQASVSKVHIQHGHKVDCPARICIYKGNLPTRGLPTRKYIEEVILRNHKP